MAGFDLDDFLHYFDSVRQRTRRIAELIPADRVEWACRPEAFSLGDLVRHIAVAERYIWAETVHNRKAAYTTHGRELADGRDAVLAFLDRMHEESMPLFRQLTPEALTGKCVAPTGVPITTWKWLRLMTEHEIHHRGQLYIYLGLLGIATPPLYGVTSQQVRAIAHG